MLPVSISCYFDDIGSFKQVFVKLTIYIKLDSRRNKGMSKMSNQMSVDLINTVDLHQLVPKFSLSLKLTLDFT